MEVKLVHCVRGAIYDVIVDLRPDSPTYCEWEAVTLLAKKQYQLYVPKYFAHGFQTLEDDTEILYQMSESYHPESARGIRWDDPTFEINWPLAEAIISPKDQSWPMFSNL